MASALPALGSAVRGGRWFGGGRASGRGARAAAHPHPPRRQLSSGDDPAPAPPPAQDADPLADVELGLLIGAGAYGRVYRGLWRGVPVAVKVVPHGEPEASPPSPVEFSVDVSTGESAGPDTRRAAAAAASGSADPDAPPAGAAASLRGALELMHSVNLDHPNIVKTYKSAQRTLRAPGGAAAAARPRGSRAPPPRGLAETWLVMEYCDGGNLQDAVDRGAFWERPAAGAAPVRVGEAVPPDAPRPSPAPAISGGGGSFDSSLHGGWPALAPGAGAPAGAAAGAAGLAPCMPAIAATAREVAAAMAYLHAIDILHGDLAGGNVLLCSRGADPAGARARGFCVKVADFGLARVLDADAVSTGTYGTVTHMPPELLTTGRLSKVSGRGGAREGPRRLETRHSRRPPRAPSFRPPTSTPLACSCGRCTPGAGRGRA